MIGSRTAASTVELLGSELSPVQTYSLPNVTSEGSPEVPVGSNSQVPATILERRAEPRAQRPPWLLGLTAGPGEVPVPLGRSAALASPQPGSLLDAGHPAPGQVSALVMYMPSTNEYETSLYQMLLLPLPQVVLLHCVQVLMTSAPEMMGFAPEPYAPNTMRELGLPEFTGSRFSRQVSPA